MIPVGTHKVKIIDAAITECRYAKEDPNRSDIALQVQTEDGETDWWRGEVSNNYGRGPVSHLTQTQLTTQTLSKIGLPNDDIRRFKELVGTFTEATWEQSTCGKYVNVKYVGPPSGGGNAPAEMSQAETDRRLSLLMGDPNQGQQQQQQQNNGFQPSQGGFQDQNPNPQQQGQGQATGGWGVQPGHSQ